MLVARTDLVCDLQPQHCRAESFTALMLAGGHKMTGLPMKQRAMSSHISRFVF
jgi:hypothetical protein